MRRWPPSPSSPFLPLPSPCRLHTADLASLPPFRFHGLHVVATLFSREIPRSAIYIFDVASSTPLMLLVRNLPLTCVPRCSFSPPPACSLFQLPLYLAPPRQPTAPLQFLPQRDCAMHTSGITVETSRLLVAIKEEYLEKARQHHKRVNISSFLENCSSHNV